MVDKPSLVQIETPDGLTLPGMFYEAPHSKKAAIYLHGNGSSSVFYKDDFRSEQARVLNDKGISYLLFNNRGAHYIKALKVKKKNGEEERKLFGMAYERIKECIYDIDGAIAFLKKKGYTDFCLIGESTGANKVCVYHFYKKKNDIAKYILLSGGDDTGFYYDMLGRERFYRLLQEAKEKIRKGEGEHLITELLPDDFFSYTAFYDMAKPDGDYNTFPFLEVMQQIKLSRKKLFRYFASIDKPSLVVYGANDEFAWGDVTRVVALLKEQKPEFSYHIISDADHSFSKHQKELAKVIAEWVVREG